MNASAELRCRCGEVRAVLKNPSPRTVNRITCFCDDCQAYAHRLGRADLLDIHGGTDIVQAAPAALAFVQGQDKIAGLRLSPKGLYRWYARCCNTPVGNMASPSIPFVGLLTQSFASEQQNPDQLFGQPVGAILGKYAVGEVPKTAQGVSFALILRTLRLILSWRLSGKTWPHPFFDQTTRQPRYPVTVLTQEQREALRPLCGPRAAAQTAP